MNCFIFLFILIVNQILSSKDIETRWSEFKTAYNKSYRSSRIEQKRFLIFKDNVETIQIHNEKYLNGLTSFEMGINEHSDLTPEEFQKRYNSEEPMEFLELNNYTFALPKFTPHKSRDWREEGIITPVKRQKACRSCYAFSAVATIEAQYVLETGVVDRFSEQYVIDCSSNIRYRNKGCHGGSRKRVFHFVQERGIAFEQEYRQYAAKKFPCRHRGGENIISKYIALRPGDENELMRYVDYFGPVSVSYSASSNFGHYKSGVMDDKQCSKKKLGHSGLIVGYGKERGVDYWIVKNSWGDQWGDKGFIKMSRNKDNQCGIASNPLIVLF